MSTERGLTLALVALAACSGSSRRTPAAAPPPPDVLAACAPLRPEPANPVLGSLPRRAEPLVGPEVGAGTFELAALRGKVVLVNLTSSWNGLVGDERPTLQGLANAIGPDLAVVRVLSESTLEDARGEQARAPGLRHVFDQDRGDCSSIGPITSAWGVTKVPESYLIDRAGNVRFYFVNKRDWSTPEAAACVRALLADTTPPIAEAPRGVGPPAGCAGGPDTTGIPSASSDVEVARGTIRFAPAMERRARPGQVLVVARHVDDGGQPAGAPLGVARLEYTGGPMEFVIVQMLAGVAIEGDIVINARWDQDGDAMTKQPGDITGVARAVAPARGVALVLDTVLP